MFPTIFLKEHWSLCDLYFLNLDILNLLCTMDSFDHLMKCLDPFPRGIFLMYKIINIRLPKKAIVQEYNSVCLWTLLFMSLWLCLWSSSHKSAPTPTLLIIEILLIFQSLFNSHFLCATLPLLPAPSVFTTLPFALS